MICTARIRQPKLNKLKRFARENTVQPSSLRTLTTNTTPSGIKTIVLGAGVSSTCTQVTSLVKIPPCLNFNLSNSGCSRERKRHIVALLSPFHPGMKLWGPSAHKEPFYPVTIRWAGNHRRCMWASGCYRLSEWEKGHVSSIRDTNVTRLRLLWWLDVLFIDCHVTHNTHESHKLQDPFDLNTFMTL